MRHINCCVCTLCLLIFIAIKFLWIMLSFLSMIIYEALYRRMPFLRAIIFMDFVDFSDFHENFSLKIIRNPITTQIAD